MKQTAVVVFTVDADLLNEDVNAEMQAWCVDDYASWGDEEAEPELEVDLTNASADLEDKLRELFGKGLVASTMFVDDELTYMGRRMRNTKNLVKRILRAGQPHE